tara:strand:- start:1240 stop:1506 length:267 start_codon:yes stop_codon:yes gene_type:complete
MELLKFKNRIIIKGYPLAKIVHTTAEAICIHFIGYNKRRNRWIPKKIITIDHSKDVNVNYEDVKEINISLPEWFLNTDKMRLILMPTN